MTVESLHSLINQWSSPIDALAVAYCEELEQCPAITIAYVLAGGTTQYQRLYSMSK